MPGLKYKLYQSNREGDFKGKWYARAFYDKKSDTLTTDRLAEKIAAATTLTSTDIKACIEAFLNYVRDGLIDGCRVELAGFGTFKCGISTAPADKASDFNVSKNIKGVHIIFVPATYSDRSGGSKRFVKSLISGITVSEAARYSVEDEEADGSGT